VLIEGRYDGLFIADEHYIPIQRDFSDADDAMRKFADHSIRHRVADRAYDFVREHLTYERLMERVRTAVGALVQ
jgi:hypothetical protein